MGLLDKPKLLLKKKYEMEKANAKFKINLALEKLFFSIPSKIQLLKTAMFLILSTILSQILKGFNKEDTKNFLRTDKKAKTILKFTSEDINEDGLQLCVKIVMKNILEKKC